MSFQVPPKPANYFPRGAFLGRSAVLALEKMLRKRDLALSPAAVLSNEYPLPTASLQLVAGRVNCDVLKMRPTNTATDVTATLVAPGHHATAQGTGSFAAVTASHVLVVTLGPIPGVLPSGGNISVPFSGSEAAIADFVATFNTYVGGTSTPVLQASNSGGKFRIDALYGGSSGFTVLSHANGSSSDVLTSLGFTDVNLVATADAGSPNVASSYSISLAEIAAMAVAAGIPAFVADAPLHPTTKQVLYCPVPRGVAADYTGNVAVALGLLSSGQSVLDHASALVSNPPNQVRPRPVRIGRMVVLLP